tara:strand:+ start:1531 stop:1695 length:165 start_codon:yes stop_codon:yes gene_type:complete
MPSHLKFQLEGILFSQKPARSELKEFFRNKGNEKMKTKISNNKIIKNKIKNKIE